MRCDNLFDFASLALPSLFRLTQTTLVDMRLVIPQSRPSGLLSLVLRRCKQSYNLNQIFYPQVLPRPRRKSYSNLSQVAPAHPSSASRLCSLKSSSSISFHLRTWILPFASRMQGQSRRGSPQPPPAWTCLSCLTTRLCPFLQHISVDLQLPPLCGYIF